MKNALTSTPNFALKNLGTHACNPAVGCPQNERCLYCYVPSGPVSWRIQAAGGYGRPQFRMNLKIYPRGKKDLFYQTENNNIKDFSIAYQYFLQYNFHMV